MRFCLAICHVRQRVTIYLPRAAVLPACYCFQRLKYPQKEASISLSRKHSKRAPSALGNNYASFDQLCCKKSLLTTDVQYEQATTDVQYGQTTTDVQYVQNTTDVQYMQTATDVQYVQSTTDVQYMQTMTDVQYMQTMTDVQYGQTTTDVQYGQTTTDVQYEQTYMFCK